MTTRGPIPRCILQDHLESSCRQNSDSAALMNTRNLYLKKSPRSIRKPSPAHDPLLLPTQRRVRTTPGQRQDTRSLRGKVPSPCRSLGGRQPQRCCLWPKDPVSSELALITSLSFTYSVPNPRVFPLPSGITCFLREVVSVASLNKAQCLYSR